MRPRNTGIRLLQAGLYQASDKVTTKARQLRLQLNFEAAWYQRQLTECQAVELLQNQPEGAFVVYGTEGGPADRLYLTVVQESWKTEPKRRAATHWTGTIQHTDSGFRLREDSRMIFFATLQALVKHYAQEPYCVDFAGEERRLINMDKVGQPWLKRCGLVGGR